MNGLYPMPWRINNNGDKCTLEDANGSEIAYAYSDDHGRIECDGYMIANTLLNMLADATAKYGNIDARLTAVELDIRQLKHTAQEHRYRSPQMMTVSEAALKEASDTGGVVTVKWPENVCWPDQRTPVTAESFLKDVDNLG